MLTLLDTLMHEYGWTIEYTLWGASLAIELALYAAIDARYGNEAKGPNYVEQAMIEELNR